MTTVQRYLLVELIRNFLFTFVVLAAIIAMLIFSVLALQTSTATLSLRAVTEMVGLLCLERFDVLVPLAVLTAVIWTFGRAQTDGEIVAMRSAGIHVYHLIVPALVLGAGAALLLAWIQDDVLPWSHYRRLVIGKRHLAHNIQGLLLDANKEIGDRRFKVRWDSIGRDPDGFLILREVVVAETKTNDGEPRITRARLARPMVNPDTSELSLALDGLVRGNELASEEMTVRLNLRALSEEPPPTRREDDLSYEELLSEGRRYEGEPRGRAMTAAFHQRAASALAAFLFAVLGVPLGVLLRTANRAVVFAIGFLTVLVFHYGPTLIAGGMAEQGVVKPIAVWSGDVLIVIIASVLLVRVLRR